MNTTLIKKELKHNWKITAIFIAVLAMYSSIMTMMYDPELGDMLASFAETMPSIFDAFGMSSNANTLVGFLSNYLYGFICVVFPMIYIVMLTSRLVTRYVDKGSMAYLLATPNTRFSLILTQAVLLVAGVFGLVAFVTVFCVGIGSVMFPGELEITKFLVLNFGLFCLLFFLASVCFLFACIFNEARYATGLGATAVIGTYIVQMVSQIDEKLEVFQYFTPFTLFDSMKLIDMETSAIISVFALLVSGVILFVVGMKIFCKKDMPL